MFLFGNETVDNVAVQPSIIEYPHRLPAPGRRLVDGKADGHGAVTADCCVAHLVQYMSPRHICQIRFLPARREYMPSELWANLRRGVLHGINLTFAGRYTPMRPKKIELALSPKSSMLRIRSCRFLMQTHAPERVILGLRTKLPLGGASRNHEQNLQRPGR